MVWNEKLHPRWPEGSGQGGEFKGWAGKVASALTGGGHHREVGQDLRAGEHRDELDLDQLWRDHPHSHFTMMGEDGTLKGIARIQGFDGPPRVATAEEMDRAVASGWTPMWRRVGQDERTGADYAEQFRAGPMWAGLGAYGNGTYAMPDWRRADAHGYGKVELRMALHPDAKVISRDDLIELMDRDENLDFYRAAMARDAQLSGAGNVMADYGRYAALRGYDAIMVSYLGMDQPTRDNPSSVMEWVILNRTALMVQGG